MDIRRREAELFLLRYDGEETEAVRHLRNVLPILDAAESAAVEMRNRFHDWEETRAKWFEWRMCTAGVMAAKDCTFYGKEEAKK